MTNLIVKIVHYLIEGALFFLPRQKKIALERRFRGRLELRDIRASDVVLLSYAKSGRTWLRVMLSHFYQQRHGIDQQHLLEFDNLKRMNPEIPAVFFTHGNYIADFTGGTEWRRCFHDKKVILLLRDPRDVAVSQFFQWKHRMKPWKKALNDYPPHGSEISLFDFVMRPQSGLPKIIDFMNAWQAEHAQIQALLLVRYEDLRAHPEETMARIFDFLGTPGSADEVKETVAFAAYENMKKLEEKKAFSASSGGRVVAGDPDNPDSFKVRRAKVGGYRDYFDDDEVAKIEAMLAAELSPEFGYLPATTAADAKTASG